MMLKKKSGIFVLILVVIINSSELFAQCAMCKATAESSIKNGGSIAKGLNFGILYLMAIPYVLLASLAFFFFKKQIIEKMKALKSKF